MAQHVMPETTTTSWMMATEEEPFSHERTMRLARAWGTWLARRGVRQAELYWGCPITPATVLLHDSVVTGLLVTGVALTRFPTWQAPLAADAVPAGPAAVVLRSDGHHLSLDVFCAGVRLDEAQRQEVDDIVGGDLWAFGAASLIAAPARGW
jgi:hypothetical protein